MLRSGLGKKYQCSICRQKYSKIEEIRAHIKEIHLAHVTCSLCDKLFPNIIELSTHRKLHFKDAPDNLSKENKGIPHTSKVKDKEGDGELSSSSFRENAEVGPAENYWKVNSKSPLSCHANDSESNVSKLNCATNQDESHDPVFASANLLSKHKNSENSVTSDNLPQQREDTNEYLAKNDKEEVGPAENYWKVNSKSPLSCHANDSESNVSKLNCVTNQDESHDPVFASANLLSKHKNSENSVTSDNLPQQRENTNEYLAKNDKEVKQAISTGPSTEFLSQGNCWQATSMGATSKELETTADGMKCTTEQGALFSICNEDYVIIPSKETIYIKMPEYVEIPTDLINASNKKHLDHVKCYSEKPKEFNCNFCKKTYDNIKDVQSHIKKTHVNLLICLLCNERFSTRSQYLSHSNSHLNSALAPPEGRTIHCENFGEDSSVGKEKEITGKAEKNVISPEVRKHKPPKSGKPKEYKCRICQEKFSCVEDVRVHIKKVHLADLTCRLCDKIFKNKYSLIDHAKEHFGGILNSSFTQSDDSNDNCLKIPPKNGPEDDCLSLDTGSTDCNDCVGTVGRCESDNDIQAHEDECHKCDKCSLFFDSSSALTVHQKMHKKVLYKCGMCEFTSSSKECVIAHLNQECHSFQGDFNDDH